jgi:sec-independent protein translocase protein TatB
MLPEIGASELLVIAVVALIVVGPKDLPVLLRRVGQFFNKLRGMAAEFRASFDEMARQSELDELRKEVEAMRRGQFAEMGEASTAPVNQAFDEIERDLADVGVQLSPPPMSFRIAEAVEPEAPPVPVKKPRKPRAPKVVEGEA